MKAKQEEATEATNVTEVHAFRHGGLRTLESLELQFESQVARIGIKAALLPAAAEPRGVFHSHGCDTWDSRANSFVVRWDAAHAVVEC